MRNPSFCRMPPRCSRHVTLLASLNDPLPCTARLWTRRIGGGAAAVGWSADSLRYHRRVAVARRLGRRMPSPNRYRWRFRPMQCRPIVDPRLSCSLRSDLPTVVTAGDRCRFGVTSPAPPDSINGEVCQCPAIRQQRERNPTAATHSSLLKRQEARCPIQHRHSVAASL